MRAHNFTEEDPWKFFGLSTEPSGKHYFIIMEDEMEDYVEPLEWTWKETLLSIPLALIVLGTILGNSLVLYAAFTRRSKLRLPTHFLIANMAVADFLVGVLVMPFLATLQVTERWYFGSAYCEAWTVIHFWLCSSSILSTCAVCVERYVGVKYPLDHKSIMRRTRIWAMIATVWVTAMILDLTSLYIWPQPKTGLPYVCEINQQIGHVIIAVVGILYIPAIIMIVLYWQIFLIASRHLKFMKHNSTFGLNIASRYESSPDAGKQNGFARFFKSSQSSVPYLSSSASTEINLSSTSPRGSSECIDVHSGPTEKNHAAGTGPQKKGSTVSATSSGTVGSAISSALSKTNLANTVQSKKQINLAKRLSFLVGVLLVSYVPFFTLYMVMAFYPGSVDIRVFNAFGWIRYFNSCLNPFIYAFAVPAYRKAMTEIISKLLSKLRSPFSRG